ncbi:MAG TPA: DUF3667 domain-containing protein [Thermoanaerobaculia bacterium]
METYEEHAEQPAPRRCTNCAAEGADVYCPKCGEKQPDHHDLTVAHVAHEAAHELLHLDSKLFATLRALVLKPGLLTVEYFAGRKTRYIAPLRLFLTFFALQFVAFSVYEPAALYSVDAVTAMDASGGFDKLVARVAGKRGVPLDTFKERVDAKWQKTITWFQLLNILGLAVILHLLHRRRFFAEHLVFSAHMLSFSYFASLVPWPIYAAYGIRPGPVQSLISFVFTVVLLVYGYAAIRRFYGSSKAWAIVQTAVISFCVTAVSFVFMFVGLFFALATVR